jgi:bla regulator protein blaR1
MSLLIALLTLVPSAGFGQFDAVSIKPSSPDARGGGFNVSPGRLNGKNVSLKDLVRFAYEIHDYQLSGSQGWTETEHYEVLATFPPDTTSAQRVQMLQTMLADRFALTIHREPKDVAGYALTVNKNGAKLHPPEDPQPGMMLGRSPTSGQRTLHGTSATMAGLASILADLLGRPVEDATALAGKFDFSMEWTPDAVSEAPLRKGGGPQETPPAGDQTGPTIFTALQEQLGLKLETKKIPVSAIVIDHAEKPSAN